MDKTLLLGGELKVTKEKYMNKYYIGQIFIGNYPKDAVAWINNNNLLIKEIDAIDGLRRFIIEECEPIEPIDVNVLKCTKRVLALCLQKFGISYTQLKELIATNEQAQLEWDLCVELERSNPLLDIMGKQLNITPEQIDNIFKFANGEIESLEV